MSRKKRAIRRRNLVIGVFLLSGCYIYNVTQSSERFTEQSKAQTHVTDDPHKQASFGYGTNVKKPTGPYTEEEIQDAVTSGPIRIQTIISESDQFVERLRDELVRRENRRKEDTPFQFQSIITPAVREQIDAQVEDLNEAALLADQMRQASQNNQPDSYSIRAIQREEMAHLVDHLNRFGRTLEQYTVSTSFQSVTEASDYLSANKETLLYGTPFETAYDVSLLTLNPREDDTAIDTFPYETAMNAFMELSQAKSLMRNEANQLRLSISEYPKGQLSLDVSKLNTGLMHFEHALSLLTDTDYPNYVSPDHIRVKHAYEILNRNIIPLQQLLSSVDSSAVRQTVRDRLSEIEETLDFTMTGSQRMFREYEPADASYDQ